MVMFSLTSSAVNTALGSLNVVLEAVAVPLVPVTGASPMMQVATGPGGEAEAPPEFPQPYEAGVTVTVLLVAATAEARVAPIKTVGAGTDMADPVGPTGLTNPGAPDAPAPHQLHVSHELTVTVWPAAKPVLGVSEAVGVAGVGVPAYRIPTVEATYEWPLWSATTVPRLQSTKPALTWACEGGQVAPGSVP
jgi:hypothetical protein